MKILAIDSTAKTAAAALSEDGALLCELTQNAGNTHSEALLPAVERILSAFSLTPRQVGLYAVTCGPGSFTGVRIGAATVKGLAYTDTEAGEEEIPVAAVSTLSALAYNFEGVPTDGALIVPVMDARRSQVYTALFSLDSDGKPLRETDDAAMSLDELGALLGRSANDRRVFFCGDGYAVTEKYFGTHPHDLEICQTPEALRWPRGLSVARCGLDAYLRGEYTTAARLSPTYLRLPQAERERLEKENS